LIKSDYPPTFAGIMITCFIQLAGSIISSSPNSNNVRPLYILKKTSKGGGE